MSNNRDTKFQGFAKLLMRDLEAVSTTTYVSLDKAREAYELAITRRAYDFACHVVDSGSPHISHVSDMTAWPEEESDARH